MTLLQARIILRKRNECSEQLKRKWGCGGRCSVCPYFTTLDEYIAAKRIVQNRAKMEGAEG